MLVSRSARRAPKHALSTYRRHAVTHVAQIFFVVLPLMIGEWVEFADLYWRFVVAVTILAAVGTALIPLLNVLLAPKKPRPAHLTAPAVSPGLQPWPTYADGVTPLPVLPDGSPDWNACSHARRSFTSVWCVMHGTRNCRDTS